MSLDIDMQPLFDSINEWFPVLMPILAIPAGIGIALMLANFLVEKFRGAFK